LKQFIFKIEIAIFAKEVALSHRGVGPYGPEAEAEATSQRPGQANDRPGSEI